jgi:hypothetical protein
MMAKSRRFSWQLRRQAACLMAFLSKPRQNRLCWLIQKSMEKQWLLARFGECEGMAQPVARRSLVSPLINKDFRGCSLTLARGNLASATLNHQMWPRARFILQNFERQARILKATRRNHGHDVLVIRHDSARRIAAIVSAYSCGVNILGSWGCS